MANSSGVRSISEHSEHGYIIYDARLSGQISAQWFDPEYWKTHGELETVATGRGQAWFIQSQDQQLVLRHYCRGGLAASFSPDRYVWTGLQRTRAWREYHLLARLQALGLPAPRPVAARVVRSGILYRADLLTLRIPDSQPLSRILEQQGLDSEHWQEIGKCIRAFHRHAIRHADLNAHNILLDSHGRVYLIDFDKSGVDQDRSWQQMTLDRLHRSLHKLQAQFTDYHFTEHDWQALQNGYRS
ncbi:MAG: 3-deoxy-D-manno-octulosonic acid kinase [Gammaproteobacteria bacterium]|nr:3-deoxy-D-manno-octulosonic acid kinase [Gammaproteobacteria bacterium]